MNTGYRDRKWLELAQNRVYSLCYQQSNLRIMHPDYCLSSLLCTRDAGSIDSFHLMNDLMNSKRILYLILLQFWDDISLLCNEQKPYSNLKVCHPRCVRSIIQSSSVYISIYTYSHETQQLYIISSDIYNMQLHVSALYVGHHQVV